MTTATAGNTSTGGTMADPGDSTTTTGTTAPPSTSTLDPTTGAVGSSGDTTGSFIILPDGFTCAVGPHGGLRCSQCDQWVQDCPEGEKCSPYSGDGDNSWESLKCVPLDPNPDHAGEPCTVEGSGVSGIDSCDLDSMCWNVDSETLTGVCVPFCKGTPDDPICPPATNCSNSNDGALTICLPMCDPLLQDCPGDDLCIPSPQNPSGFLCVVDASGEEGQAFDPCEFANACDRGLICANPTLASECDPNAAGCCLPFCDITQPDCPGAMQQCIPWWDMDPPPGLENLGLCGLPQ